jgi:hypothetical protein
MACRISELVIDAEDPDRLAAFWCEVLGYVELAREDDGSIEIGPPGVGFGGAQPTLIFNAGRDPRLGKLPLHIDVNATDRDQDAELARLLALGAVPVDIGATSIRPDLLVSHSRAAGEPQPPAGGHSAAAPRPGVAGSAADPARRCGKTVWFTCLG